jgi:hypothetical protein
MPPQRDTNSQSQGLTSPGERNPQYDPYKPAFNKVEMFLTPFLRRILTIVKLPALFLLSVLLFTPVRAPAQRPTIFTENATTLGKNKYNGGIAFEYLHKSSLQPLPFPRSLYRLFVVALHSGVAENVDMDLNWRGGLVGVRSDGFRSFDWGDLVVATKLLFFPQHDGIPAAGLRTSIKLPNSTYHPNRLGSNEMDYFTHLLLTQRWVKTELRCNIGFGIVGDPRVPGQQDDVYTLAIAGLFTVSETLKSFAEIAGMTGYQDNDDKVVVRCGISLEAEGLTWDVYGSARLFGNSLDFATAFDMSESWGIGMNIRKQFSFDPFGFIQTSATSE